MIIAFTLALPVAASVTPDSSSYVQLEQLVNTPERNALAARAYTALAGGRRAIVFCVGVEVGPLPGGSTCIPVLS